MKKMNLLVMSLVSAAALSFTSCSSNDDLAGDNADQAKVDGFYMTLNVQTPKADGTRTAVIDPTENATAVEAAIKTGTFYLVDKDNKIVFSENLKDLTWSGAVNGENGTTTQQDGNKTFEIKVENVEAGQTYRVYFLAGSNKPAGDMNFAATSNNFFTAATNSFASPFADANNFAMFNQNDADVNGNGYSVEFIKANNNKQNPAKVTYTSADGKTTQKDAHTEGIIGFARNCKGVALHSFRRQPKEAIRQYRLSYEALMRSDRMETAPDVCANLADAYSFDSDLPNAAVWYRRALFLVDSLQLEPTRNITLYMGLGRVYMMLEDYKSAKKYLDATEKMYYSFRVGIFLLFFEKVQSPVGHGSGGIRFRFRKEYLAQTDVVFIVFGTVFRFFHPLLRHRPCHRRTEGNGVVKCPQTLQRQCVGYLPVFSPL